MIVKGQIPSRDLFTLRRGEMTYDNVREQWRPAYTDIIRIKAKAGSRACRFYSDEQGCTIYPHRPQECRVLKCWDPAEVMELYERDRLTRRDLLADIPHLWELVTAHENRCGYVHIRELATAVREARDEAAGSELAEIIGYDRHFRQLAVEKGGIDPEILDFLLGRPLSDAIYGFGLRLLPKSDRILLVPLP